MCCLKRVYSSHVDGGSHRKFRSTMFDGIFIGCEGGRFSLKAGCIASGCVHYLINYVDDYANQMLSLDWRRKGRLPDHHTLFRKHSTALHTRACSSLFGRTIFRSPTKEGEEKKAKTTTAKLRRFSYESFVLLLLNSINFLFIFVWSISKKRSSCRPHDEQEEEEKKAEKEERRGKFLQEKSEMKVLNTRKNMIQLIASCRGKQIQISPSRSPSSNLDLPHRTPVRVAHQSWKFN